MEIEVVGVDLPLAEVSRIVRRMAEELECEAHWDGKVFRLTQEASGLEQDIGGDPTKSKLEDAGI